MTSPGTLATYDSTFCYVVHPGKIPESKAESARIAPCHRYFSILSCVWYSSWCLSRETWWASMGHDIIPQILRLCWWHLIAPSPVHFGTLNLKRETNKVGLKINSNNIKVLSLTGYPTLPTCINGQNSEGVDQLVYLRNVIFLPTVVPNLMSLHTLTAPLLLCPISGNEVRSTPKSNWECPVLTFFLWTVDLIHWSEVGNGSG